MHLVTITHPMHADIIPFNYLQKSSEAGLLSLSQSVKKDPLQIWTGEMETHLSQFIRTADVHIGAWIKRSAFA